ncbi:hypothetical protein AMATHDRAFT_77020 [Amanita thiersii Skay4041]|uniref:RWD domain-containing protein n=1 Tax=Amanita thiersii Skay4041 TaxID=703135 RepID=A0A2A9NJ56_9AGAR|nr:hypothetical protein AMATHDRAFT_77020 [Amanita thiersii Skay4041]
MAHPDLHIDDTDDLQLFIDRLNASDKPEHAAIASEIEVLQSIYGDNSIRLWSPPGGDANNGGHLRGISPDSPNDDGDTPSLRILVSLPSTYPTSSPPQLQLLSKYIGPFGADSALFGAILRTFISVNGVEWSPDTVCVFDGLQNVIERCTKWYEDRLSVERAGELVRADEKAGGGVAKEADGGGGGVARTRGEGGVDATTPPTSGLPAGIQLHVADPITDRKSVFVGRACQISSPSEIPLILSHLMSDRRIARAAHPIINAWRCQVGAVLHQDNDDDGETAAGGRLAHLLQTLEVNNVLVIVTRYFGGIHLGPDRFKHINQAARNALELGGFLDTSPEGAKKRGRKH